MITRRDFVANLGVIGLFTVLPGAGRIWKAERKLPPGVYDCQWIPHDYNRFLILTSKGTRIANAIPVIVNVKAMPYLYEHRT